MGARLWYRSWPAVSQISNFTVVSSKQTVCVRKAATTEDWKINEIHKCSKRSLFYPTMFVSKGSPAKPFTPHLWPHKPCALISMLEWRTMTTHFAYYEALTLTCISRSNWPLSLTHRHCHIFTMFMFTRHCHISVQLNRKLSTKVDDLRGRML